MPVDLDLHRRLDAAAMAAQDPERFPWTWAPRDGERVQVWVSAADAALIVQMRNDHMAMLEELASYREHARERRSA